MRLAAVDAKGVLCPWEAGEVEISVSGAGEFTAAGNGNPHDRRGFSSKRQKLFYGRAMVAVRRTAPGEIKVCARDSITRNRLNGVAYRIMTDNQGLVRLVVDAETGAVLPHLYASSSNIVAGMKQNARAWSRMTRETTSMSRPRNFLNASSHPPSRRTESLPESGW